MKNRNNPLILIGRDNGRTYAFERSWFKPGGALHGANYFTDICVRGHSDKPSTRVRLMDNVYVYSGADDPDYLYYLLKKGMGEKFDALISEDEILFLHQFYTANGFTCMLPDVARASERIEMQKNKCVVV